MKKLNRLTRRAERAEERGDHQLAYRLHGKRLKLVRRRRGETDYRFAAVLNDLGLCCGELRRFEEAEACFEDCIALTQARHGDDFFEIALYLTNLGGVLKQGGRASDAAAVFRRAGRTLRRLSPPDSEYVTVLIDAAANPADRSAVPDGEGAWDGEEEDGSEEERVAARAAAGRAVAFAGDMYGHDLPAADALFALAGSHVAEERFAEAEALCAHCLGVWERHYGPRHAYTGRALRVLAQIYMNTDREEKVPTVLERCAVVEACSGVEFEE